ncbi:MAG: S41 family peptidase [Acidobacteriota bacterium]
MRAFRVLSIVLLLPPLVGCSWMARHRHPTAKHSAGAPAPRPTITAATRKNRQVILDALLEQLRDNYMALETDPILDRFRAQRETLLATSSPDAFYQAINGILHQSGHRHLYLYRPGRDLFGHDPKTGAVLGATSTTIDGVTYVDDVWEGGPAAEAGLLYGDEIIEEPGHGPDRLEDLPEGVLTRTIRIRHSRQGEPITTTLHAAVGDTLWYLAQASRSSIRRMARGPCRVGLIHLRTFADEDLIEDLVTGAQFNEVDGLVIDLRGNRGGEIRLAAELFDLLTRRPSVYIQYNHRQYSFPPTNWNHPLAVLVDGHTGSAAEIFAAAVQILHLGAVIGTSTAGEVQASRLFDLPDGSRLMVPISTVSLPDGTDLQGHGVVPEINVQRPLPYAAGADPPLEKALDTLADEMVCGGEVPEERFPQEKLAPPPDPSQHGPDRTPVP